MSCNWRALELLGRLTKCDQEGTRELAAIGRVSREQRQRILTTLLGGRCLVQVGQVVPGRDVWVWLPPNSSPPGSPQLPTGPWPGSLEDIKVQGQAQLWDLPVWLRNPNSLRTLCPILLIAQDQCKHDCVCLWACSPNDFCTSFTSALVGYSHWKWNRE